MSVLFCFSVEESGLKVKYSLWKPSPLDPSPRGRGAKLIRKEYIKSRVMWSKTVMSYETVFCPLLLEEKG